MKGAASSSAGYGRTGYKQKQAEFEAVSRDVKPSALVEVLLMKRAWGNLSSPDVQQIAAAALEDGSDHPDVHALASLGSFGRFPGKCHQELEAKMGANPIQESIKFILLVLRRPPMRTETVQQTILYPHELFATIYHQYPQVFKDQICGGSPGNIPKFWDSMREHPAYSAHPMHSSPDFHQKCLSLALHGDGVPVTGVGKTWSNSADIFSWASCLGRGATVASHFLIFFLFKSICAVSAGRSTTACFWRHLCWSMHWLFRGVWPDVDADGQSYKRGTPEFKRKLTKLADGYRGALWIVKGDLAYVANDLGLRHPASVQPCALCLANSTTLPWTDCRKGIALWEGTVWNNESWWHANPGRHDLFHLPGVGITAFVPDLLHTKHLGTDSYFYGSVLAFLTSHCMGGSAQDNLDLLRSEIQEHYRLHGVSCKFQNMKLSMFENPGGFPRLKGRGAEIRHLAAPLHFVFCKHMDEANKQHRQIKLALAFSVELEEMLDSFADAYTFPQDVADRFLRSCYSFVALVSALGQHFHNEGTLLFNFTVKSHYLLHIGRVAQYMNPRLAWCYAGEDFMHVMKTIIAASSSGTAPHLVVSKALRKYVQGLHMTFVQGRRRVM